MDEPLEIAPGELARMRATGEALHLVDVRNGWEHEIAAIEGDVLIPMQALGTRASELPRETPIVVYCHHGSRSWVAAQALRRAGFDARSLQGGIDRWALEIEPSLRRY